MNKGIKISELEQALDLKDTDLIPIVSEGKNLTVTGAAFRDTIQSLIPPKSELKGDKGDKGDTGARGAKGDKGDIGAKGAAGTAGVVPSGVAFIDALLVGVTKIEHMNYPVDGAWGIPIDETNEGYSIVLTYESGVTREVPIYKKGEKK